MFAVNLLFANHYSGLLEIEWLEIAVKFLFYSNRTHILGQETYNKWTAIGIAGYIVWRKTTRITVHYFGYSGQRSHLLGAIEAVSWTEWKKIHKSFEETAWAARTFKYKGADIRLLMFP